MQAQFILYVENQEKSTNFYSKLFDKAPSLFVDGMTEFTLNNNTKLGLMPNKGIAKLFPKEIMKPQSDNDTPKCELYIEVDDVALYYNHAISLGAKSMNKPQLRDWGDYVGYVMDFDGHIIAFFNK